MSDTVRWGILGTGLIASVFANDLKLLSGAEVSAVASRHAYRATEFARRYGIPVGYGSYEDLAADESIDLVYVAVPHSAHYTAALLAIRAGKNVLVEKPFTVNAWQAERLVEAARKQGVFLMEAMWTRFLPHMVKIRQLIENGVIGEVVTVMSDHGLRFDPAHPEHRLYDPALGGGALLDLGVYPVSLVVSFLGDDIDIRALATMTSTGVDAELSAVMRDAEGRHGVITTSLSSELSNRAVISGTKGRIEIGYRFNRPRDFDVLLFNDANPATTGSSLTHPGSLAGHGIRVQAQEAARCVREKLPESPVMPHALTLKVMRAMDEMRRQTGISYPADVDRKAAAGLMPA